MMTTIGDQLHRARTATQLTQQAVATSLHVSRQTISSWETGRSFPDITSVIALSELYHLSLDDLLKGDAQIQAVLRTRDLTLHRLRHIGWLVIAIGACVIFGNAGFILDWHDFALTDTWALLLFIVMLLISATLLLLTRLEFHLRRLHMQRWVVLMFALAALAGGVFSALSNWLHWPWFIFVIFDALCSLLAYAYIRHRAKRR